MYCPKCGQQLAESMKFCSRCGLPVSEVAEWLAGAGALALRDEAQEAVAPSPRRKGMRRGAKVMFWGGILLPIFFAISIAADDPVPIFLPLIIILAGLAWLLYSRLFGEDQPHRSLKPAQGERPGAARANSALPPATDAGAVGGVRREARTAEMAQPPSVTDHTTRLLDRE